MACRALSVVFGRCLQPQPGCAPAYAKFYARRCLARRMAPLGDCVPVRSAMLEGKCGFCWPCVVRPVARFDHFGATSTQYGPRPAKVEPKLGRAGGMFASTWPGREDYWWISTRIGPISIGVGPESISFGRFWPSFVQRRTIRGDFYGSRTQRRTLGVAPLEGLAPSHLEGRRLDL